MIDGFAEKITAKRPLIHNITNYVTAADCANITLALGASPIMADDPLESEEITAASDGLVINTGTISKRRLKAMLISGRTAKKAGIPIVLDPVGAGASKFRTAAVKSVMEQIKPDIIRLNASELKSLCTGAKNVSGVDAAPGGGIDFVIRLAKQFAHDTGAVIGVSGKTDVVTDGIQTALIRGGHEMMKKITGSGCMLSSVTGAFAAAGGENFFDTVVSAFALFSSCGRKAYREGIGAASYKIVFLDMISCYNTEEIQIEYR